MYEQRWVGTSLNIFMSRLLEAGSGSQADNSVLEVKIPYYSSACTDNIICCIWNFKDVEIFSNLINKTQSLKWLST